MFEESMQWRSTKLSRQGIMVGQKLEIQVFGGLNIDEVISTKIRFRIFAGETKFINKIWTWA